MGPIRNSRLDLPAGRVCADQLSTGAVRYGPPGVASTGIGSSECGRIFLSGLVSLLAGSYLAPISRHTVGLGWGSRFAAGAHLIPTCPSDLTLASLPEDALGYLVLEAA